MDACDERGHDGPGCRTAGRVSTTASQVAESQQCRRFQETWRWPILLEFRAQVGPALGLLRCSAHPPYALNGGVTRMGNCRGLRAGLEVQGILGADPRRVGWTAGVGG